MVRVFVADGEYYLKSIVKKGTAKFESPVIKLYVDNTWPAIDQLEIFQKSQSLGCCGEIKRDGGP